MYFFLFKVVEKDRDVMLAELRTQQLITGESTSLSIEEELQKQVQTLDLMFVGVKSHHKIPPHVSNCTLL